MLSDRKGERMHRDISEMLDEGDSLHIREVTLAESLQAAPVLAGYTYDPQEAFAARDQGRLLAIRLETNRSCNLKCRYCYAESGASLANEMGYEVLSGVVRQASDLGALSVVVIGGGEPTIYPRFRELITLIDDLGMVPMIFTNLTTMTIDLAGFLYEKNVTVMGKMDSQRPEVQDFLIGKPGAHERISRGLDNLMRSGFASGDDPHRLRLGISCVTCSLNLDEIEDIWRFCRENNIFPNMEVLTPTGRAKKQLPDCFITDEDIREYKLRLLDIDREWYGFDWLPYTPLPGSGCLQYLFSMYITVEGNVRPCAPTKFDENPALREDGAYPNNVLARPLAEIYRTPLFEYARNIDSHLEGKCAACVHGRECIGCRGYAYSVGVNEGKDPFAALRRECLQCFK
jgi:MoaA/NifB/PqqE/SkfB family radical SAM enzyme